MGNTEEKKDENKKENKPKEKHLRKVLKYFSRYKKRITVYFIIITILAVLGFFVPILTANAVASISDLKFDDALLYAIVFFNISIIISLLNRLNGHIYIQLMYKIRADITKDIVEAVSRLTISTVDKSGTGMFIKRTSDDVWKISYSFINALETMLGIISSFGFLIYIAYLNIWLFVVMSVYLVISFILDQLRMSHWYKDRKKTNLADEDWISMNNEQIRGLRDVKALNIRQNLNRKNEELLDKTIKLEKRAEEKWGIFIMVRSIFNNIIEAGLVIIGVLFIQHKIIALATFLIAYLYKSHIKSMSTEVGWIKQQLSEGNLAAGRIFEVINDMPKEEFGNKEIENCQGLVEFKEVTFGYDDKSKVLKQFSAQFKPGTISAIVGESGGGKTTALNLISKFYAVNQGAVLLDGENINELTENAVRENIAIVNQIPYLFNFTIKENLLCVKPNATDEELEQALTKAKLHDFVNGLEKKMDSLIGENGIVLSGGQRQRLSIARVLLKGCKVICFDESTSALDNVHQSEVMDVIKSLKAEHTIIIVAHRLSSILHSDNILVMKNGKLVAEGKHKKLLENCAEYKKLYLQEEKQSKK